MNEQFMVQDYLESKGFTVVNTSGPANRSDVILCWRYDGRLVVVGVAEIKSRVSAGKDKLTRQYLKDHGGYLITHDKIISGSALAK